MIVALTVRRLKRARMTRSGRPGSPTTGPRSGRRPTTSGNVNDENEVISFGFFNGTLEELQATRPGGGGEEERQSRMAEFVDSTGADGLYEVIEEVGPPR